MINDNEKKPINVLVIDNDKEFNKQLSFAFKKVGFRPIQAFDLESATKYIENLKSKLSLVVLTNDLPEKQSGTLFTLARKLNIKVIITSAQEDNTKREQYFKNGVLDYHLKSNDIKHIVNDIDESYKRLEENSQDTILVIDDSKVVCGIVKYLLNNKNYNVLTAISATEGLNILKDHPISLLLLDMELPDIHGIEVLSILRDRYLINNFPTLVLSGSDNPSIVRQALKKGASDFLRKPFNYEEFLLKVDLWTKSSRWQKTIKEQKLQIESSLKSFEALVNSTIEALFIFERNHCIELNNEAVELLGFPSKNELLGKHIFEIFTKLSQEHQDQLLDKELNHFFEDILITNEKKELQVQIKERNIIQQNTAVKIIAVMDITQIKQNEKMLSHQTKMASMGEMIGNIAHQWRQPLTAISVAAGGIKLNYELDMIDEEETIKELDNIVNNTQFLSSTIEDFQNFLKDNRSTTNFSLKETIDKTLSIIKGNLESSSIKIINRYDQRIQLNGVQNDLIQVFLNIINNAVDILKSKKEIENKYIIIETFCEQQYIHAIIQDNAGGVPNDIINKIFEPYFTTKHQSQGTGLGLYMTHQIVEGKLGGFIEVENKSFALEENQHHGASFDINIPISMKA